MTIRAASTLALLACWGLAACRDGTGIYRDSGVDPIDTGVIVDGGTDDTGPTLVDATIRDATIFDSMIFDAGFPDSGAPADSGEVDTGVIVDGGTGLAPGPGDLVIVEIQGNPQGTADTDAEYIELLNVSGRALNLMGCHLVHLSWTGSGMAPIDSVGDHPINQSVGVAIGARVLLTRSNGGYFGGATRDYVYSGFELSNGGTTNNRFRVMAPGWNGVEPPDPASLVDEVITPEGTFDNPLRGRAWQIDPAQVASPTAANNDAASAWCYAASGTALAYWQDNWGTPRAPNACN